MPLADSLNQVKNNYKSSLDAYRVITILVEATNYIKEINQRITDLISTGNFNSVPADLKQVGNNWKKLFSDLETQLDSDTDIQNIMSNMKKR